MRFGVVSLHGAFLWGAARLHDEGNEVLVYHAPPPNKPFLTSKYKNVGKGIVPLAATWEQFMAAQPDVVIFDFIDWGDRADQLRRSGTPVFGSCAFYDRMEKEREFGIEIARSIGLEIAEYYPFGTITDALAWLGDRKSNEKWYFKTDRDLGPAFTAGGDIGALSARLQWIRARKGDRIKHILQREVIGAEISTAAYWNGHSFLYPVEGTLERKSYGNDETGPKTGCSCNVVWFYPNTPSFVDFNKLTALLRQKQAAPCIIDINAILSFNSGKAYFLEWTPRYGYDSEPTAQRLLDGEYGEFIARLCDSTLPFVPFSTDEAAMSIRFSVPPYPGPAATGEVESPEGLPLIGISGSLWGERRSDRFVAYSAMRVGGDTEYVCSDPAGSLGLSSAVGTDLNTLNKACVKYCKGLDIADLAYRTDADAELQKALANVRKAGHWAPDL